MDTALTRAGGANIQQVHVADMQHIHAAKRSRIDMQVGLTALTCSLDMQLEQVV